jgi:hypothetical protein
LDGSAMNLNVIYDALVNDLQPLRFSPPVTHVYNPLEYARESHNQYLRLYGTPPKDVVILGMNPGPWGMAQTGVPFGEVSLVEDWLGIESTVRPQVRIVHDSLAATAEMAFLPGVLGCRPLRRTVQGRFGTNPAVRLPGGPPASSERVGSRWRVGTLILALSRPQFMKYPG